MSNSTKFDPNAASMSDSGVFGLPCNEEEASLVYLPVPWEATTSYGKGTARGPSAILEASRQVDLFDRELGRPYEAGYYMLKTSDEVIAWNEAAREDSAMVVEAGGITAGNAELSGALARVNDLSAKVNQYVFSETKRLLDAGKRVAIVGGDHSVPFGAFQAVAESNPSFGILHFDAHSDTRKAFEGFTWSHASIMRNALERIPQVTRLIQVGIRDFCEDEYEFCRQQGGRVKVFYDEILARRRYEGTPWSQTTKEIIAALPEKVWISFDIDGLDQCYCPHTGTPVPGGLEFNEATYLIGELTRAGKKIIGFDLCEVAPGDDGDEWDANVGARMLYKLSGWSAPLQK